MTYMAFAIGRRGSHWFIYFGYLLATFLAVVNVVSRLPKKSFFLASKNRLIRAMGNLPGGDGR
jgi:hypothetical protein